MEITQELAVKVLNVVDAGLVRGLGNPKPGEMCVEAAVNYALGADHGDNPSCVGGAVRAFKIRLNDAEWPTNKDRTEGMRKLAIAQLGSDTIDQREFQLEVAFQTIKQIVPIALRAAGKLNPKWAEAFKLCAVACEVAVDIKVARAAAIAARDKAREVCASDAASAYASAASDAASAAAADASASDAASAYASADASAAAASASAYAYAASASASAYAYAASASAYASADASADASAADAAKKKTRLKILKICAEIGLQALIKLKSPGCEFLDLCDEKDAP